MSDPVTPGVAIVGFAGRFPGANSVARFWQHVKTGTESVTRFTDAELAAAGHDVAVLRAEPGFVAARGVIERPEWFDHGRFGMTTSEAEVTDPQQRVLLEVAWEALEHAGYDPLGCRGAVGVFAGVGANTYALHLLRHRPDLLAAAGPMLELIGRDKDFAATRIAYKLNLRGPALSINTACSTSLVTVCQAVQSLLTFQCDMALAGGASIVVPQATGYVYEEGGILSPDGHTRPFDARAQGTVFSSGAALVVLKRLEEAVADRDRIYAVIRGAALNNDGADKASYTAPSARAHAEVIALAHGLAGVSPRSISYVETHGTATPIGDPIEIAGLTEAFRHGTADCGFCAIGSVKSNIGHLDIAAGVAGLIKTALALDERVLPPSLHYSAPNPNIPFAETPFYVQTRLQPWPGPGPRLAGVSSFGVGGTNAHVVVEEPPAVRAATSATRYTLLIQSAATAEALDIATSDLADALHDDPHLGMADIAHTLRVGRHAFAHRRALVTSDRTDAVAALRSGDARRVTSGHTVARPSVVMMFPGGGAQHAGMGHGLLDHAPVYRAEIERAIDLLRDRVDLADLLLGTGVDLAEATRRLERPATGLPALCAVEYAMARQWMAWGVQPDALVGHSMGEYTAACLAGVMSFADLLALGHLRGRLFESLPAGGMLGVPLSEREVVARLAPGLDLAAVNTHTSSVVSGPPDVLERFAEALLAEGIECRRVRIAVAAHSRMVEPILAEFGGFVAGLRLSAPVLPVVSNVTGARLTADEATSPTYWTEHLRRTVRFGDGLTSVLAEAGRVLIDVGPGQTLGSFARQHPAAEGVPVVSSMRHPADVVDDLAVMLGAVGRVWTTGIDIDWTALPDARDASRVALPATPFTRQRFYAEPLTDTASASAGVAPMSLPSANASLEVATLPLPSTPIVAPAPVPMSAPAPPPLPPAPSPGVPRVERIAARVVELLQKLSGRPASALSRQASFIEMGFDSLFLTQASLRVRNEFKVKVTFRQLFEDAPSIEALARFIDGKLPAEALPAPVAPVAGPASPGGSSFPHGAGPTVTLGPSSPLPANASVLERVVHEQLRVMAEQLRLLSGAAAAVAGEGAALGAPAATWPPAASAPPVATPAASDEADRPTHFGPFRGIDTSTEALSPHQQRHLEAFIARYVERTKASKALTAAQRARLADPRAVTGFRKTWKEMVYQIATTRSSGARVWDVDGNEYIDLTSSFGVNLFGFGDDAITSAVRTQLDDGIELGTLSPLAREAADRLCRLTGMERATFANTGSEAINGAIRAVRTATGREWIAVFDDEYHGIAEEVLVKAVGPRGHQRSMPASPGIPDHMVDKVIVLHYDDPRSIDILRERADDIAGVIVEPVQNRHPDFRPIDALRAVRQVTAECDIPLIFDEMITGFRLHPRGAQGFFGIDADIACYGKIMSGGLPIAAVAGKARYLDAFDGGPWQFGDDSFPEGGVTFFGGTFTRNALSLAAATAALRRLERTPVDTWTALNATADRFAAEVNALFARYRAPMHLEHCGSIFHLAYTDDRPLPKLLCYYLRLKGIHIWDRPFFLTLAHTEADLGAVVEAVDRSLAEMQAAHFLGGTSPDDGEGARAAAVVPFTAPQMELWLGSQVSPAASAAFNEVVALALGGRLDVETLDAAIADVSGRHESLQMAVSSAPLGFRPGAPTVRTTLHDVRNEADPTTARAAVIRRYNAEPMDLATGPLWRVGVVRQREDDVLVIAVHHLMCDGWSFGVLLRELSACYAARVAGRPHDLAAPLQLSAYGRAVAARRDSDEARATEAYWLGEYRSLPEPLQLPTDRPRPAVLQYVGGRLGVVFDAALAGRVRQFAAAQRTTLFSTLQAAFNVLVHRLSGQRDLVVGIPMAGQALVEQAPLIVHGVNFLAMRCQVDPELAFQTYVQRLTAQALDLNEHQEFTYLELLRALKLPRVVDRDPLVSVSFTLDPSFASPDFGGLTSTVLSVPRATARRDLHVNMMETPAGLAVDVDYDASILDEATVRAWMEAFRTCLDAAITNPSQPLWRLPLVAGAELARLAAPAIQPAAMRFDREVTLIGHFEAQVARTPDAAAQTCDGETLTYRELNARANRIAAALAERGVDRGTLVGLAVQRGAHLLPAILGVLKAGAAYVPIDLAYPAERLAFMLRDSRAAVLLTERSLLSRLPATAASPLVVDDVIFSGPDTNPAPAAEPDDLAYVIYTSGTTGQPKGSLVTHRHVVSLMAGTASLFEFSATDVWTLFHSYAFDFSVWEMWGALFYGGRVVVVPVEISRSASAFHALLERERVTVLNQTPSAFAPLMAVDLARRSRPALALRYVVFGGEALDLASVRPWFDRHGDETPALVNMYGITETTVHVTYRRLRLADTAGGSVIGTPIPLWMVSVLDERQQPVPVGARGEMYVGGAGVSGGYLGRDELTRQRFLANPLGEGRVYRSGDLARRLPNGELEYLGRIDQQVKIRGFRVELAEIEAALRRHSAVAECRVVMNPTAGSGERRLVAYLKPAGTAPDPATLQRHLRTTLPDYMVPALYVAVDAFPLTANGKLDAQALPSPDQARLVSATVAAAPSSDVERRLAGIWRELLGVADVGRGDDFFDLGGHSLLAITLGHRVEDVFAVPLAALALFEHPRLEALAAHIESLLPPGASARGGADPAVAAGAAPTVAVTPATASTSVLARMHPGGTDAPFFWVHGIGGEVYSYMTVTAHLGRRRPVYGVAADWTKAFDVTERTVERIAAAYLREIVAVQPSGPVHLGGYCSGAVLVLEMARQLEATGRPVGAVVVVDYDAALDLARSRATQAVAFARNLPLWLRDDAFAVGVADLVGRVRSKLRRWRGANGSSPKHADAQADIRDHLGLWKFPPSKVEMLREHLRVIDAHRPRPIESRVTLLRPRAEPLLGPWRHDDTGGLTPVAGGGVDVRFVPGSHSTVLTEPYAATVAEVIETAIVKAEAASTAGVAV